MAKKSWENEHVDLLAMLKHCQNICCYNLTLYYMEEMGGQQDVSLRQCGSILQNPLCNELVIPFLDMQIKNALDIERLIVCRLHGGLLSFLVPFRSASTRYCLVGEGVREKSVNIHEIENLSKAKKIDAFEILEQVVKLPVKTNGQVQEDARQLGALLLNLQDGMDFRLLCDRTKSRLGGIMESFSQMDELNTVKDVCSLAGTLFKTLYNYPKIAFAVRDETDGGFRVKGVWGLPEDMGSISDEKLSQLISKGMVRKEIKLDGDFKHLVPGAMADHVSCFPLESHDELLGLAALFDCDMRHLDRHLAELIINRVAGKLMQLKKERHQEIVGSFASSLMSLTDSLLSAESKEELYKSLLEAAADLVGASKGSIMLVDKSGQRLQIGFSKGMSERLAGTITVRFGEGIAGRVASDGSPLLIDDIEKDPRIALGNRPRFRTKSFLCVPLKLKDRNIGVINLSDKKNLQAFSQADMNVVASFANLASLMIERTWTIERFSALEQLSITDHLTGLYNRRFMRTRLEEEINRGTRHGLNISVIFMDLDFFKIYNDLCGHLEGDRALQKAAEILKAMVRDMDIVIRYGGEEFMIILPDTAKSDAIVVAERVRKEIEKETFPCEENLPLGRLTASFGIASFPEDGHTFTTLIHAADMAMYRAKSEGRNRIVPSNPVQTSKDQ
jgi:diguanylate cyclase (GGDEF)-like protein